MSRPQTSRQLAGDIQTIGELVSDINRQVEKLAEFISSRNLKLAAELISPAAARHGMSQSQADMYAGDLIAAIRLIQDEVNEMGGTGGDLSKNIGSALHIVHAVEHRCPNPSASGVLHLNR